MPARLKSTRTPSAVKALRKSLGAERGQAASAAQSLEAAFANSMARIASHWPAAVAVSGGGDSLALMLLLAHWAKDEGLSAPTVLTVDHGLRAGSHRDAQRTKDLAEDAGLAAHVLVWNDPKPASDIESEARTARYSLMGRWCVEHDVPALYAAHTLEDQAETFLLRLARGSGLDGLAGMRAISVLPVPEFAGIRLVRPLLETARHELRAYLTARKVRWSEDPMNTDPRFARAKLRRAWPQLTKLGLLPQRIADAAGHLARARAALEEFTEGFLQRGARFQGGAAVLDPLRLKMLPREVGLRALAAVLARVSGQEYRPRFDSLERLFDSVLEGALGGGATLHGCIVAPASQRDQAFGAATIAVVREPAASKRNREPSCRVEADKGNRAG